MVAQVWAWFLPQGDVVTKLQGVCRWWVIEQQTAGWQGITAGWQGITASVGRRDLRRFHVPQVCCTGVRVSGRERRCVEAKIKPSVLCIHRIKENVLSVAADW